MRWDNLRLDDARDDAEGNGDGGRAAGPAAGRPDLPLFERGAVPGLRL